MRLRVGVIGLGRCWQRYQPLLERWREHVEVRAACDQVARRAENAARRFHCSVASGPVDLLERADVEAVLLLDPQWYGLWPLGHAEKLGKPTFCTVSLLNDGEHVDALRERMQTGGAHVLMALPPTFAPAVRYLRELLAQRLGQARLIRAEWCVVPSRTQTPRDLLRHPVLLSLLAICAGLLDDAPRSAWAIDGEGAAFVTLVLRFGGDRLAQLTLCSTEHGKTPGRIEIVAESGTATATPPRLLRWRDADGLHAQRLPARSAEQNALERFLLSRRTGQPLLPNFEDAYRALTWLRAALRSREEGRPVNLSTPESAS